MSKLIPPLLIATALGLSVSVANAAAGDAALIQNASRAAPKGVADHATIIAPDGRVLREGTNGFTCFAVFPGSHGLDPMCVDQNALEWFYAYLSGATPTPGKVGVGYMLTGETGSNTDPYATGPTSDNGWHTASPHVMLFGADAGLLDLYPKDTNPDTSAPYVMWANTPYQHLMIPIK